MSNPSEDRDEVADADEASFPASDPPAWTSMHAGAPVDAGWTNDLVTVRSAFAAADAVARIERAVTAAGMKVFATIDQAAEARAVGLSMRPLVVVIFGNPKGGTPLMIAKPTSAIDLPLKALVWEDERGDTWLTYNTPSLLVHRHGLDEALAEKLAPVGDLLRKTVTASP